MHLRRLPTRGMIDTKGFGNDHTLAPEGEERPGSHKKSLSSMVIVDCGSGYSRVSNFYRSSGTNLVRVSTTSSTIDALHTVIRCPKKSTDWLQKLTKIVKEVDTKATRVLLGATGGVRDLVSSGDIQPEDVERFRELLTKTGLSFTIRLIILSGDDEAKYEFMSVEYCVNQCCLAPVDREGRRTNAFDLGLLSSGGMSSQVFVNGVSYSLQTKVKKGNQLCLDHGIDKGKADFQQQVKKVIDQDLPASVSGENMLYVAIEMLAAAGEKAGMGGGAVVPVFQAIEMFTTFIEKKTNEDRMIGIENERTWRTYVYITTAIVGISILERLHPKSKVMFVTIFETGDNHILKPSWPLGRAIKQMSWEDW